MTAYNSDHALYILKALADREYVVGFLAHGAASGGH